MRILGPSRPPDRGGAAIYDRPSRRPLWIAAVVAVLLLMVALCALWWFR
jgi:hypothetical protein